MPLIKSKSKEAVGKNIQKEMAAGKPHDQAIAIALETQRRAMGNKKKAPGVNKKRKNMKSKKNPFKRMVQGNKSTRKMKHSR